MSIKEKLKHFTGTFKKTFNKTTLVKSEGLSFLASWMTWKSNETCTWFNSFCALHVHNTSQSTVMLLSTSYKINCSIRSKNDRRFYIELTQCLGYATYLNSEYYMASSISYLYQPKTSKCNIIMGHLLEESYLSKVNKGMILTLNNLIFFIIYKINLYLVLSIW